MARHPGEDPLGRSGTDAAVSSPGVAGSGRCDGTVAGVDRSFSLDEARAVLPEIIAIAEQIIPLRAELVAAAKGHHDGGRHVNLADVKGMEAQLSHLLDELRQRGLEVKGWAPLLVDLPVTVQGREVLVCWLEGDRRLDWYHDREHGFAGRRRLSDLLG